jgi:hypothetical protein
MNNFDIYGTVSDSQLEPEGYVVHLDRTWPACASIFNQYSLKIKNAQYPGELIITDDSPVDDKEIPDTKYYFGVLKTNFHMSSVEIDVRTLYNCSCLSFDLSCRNAYWIERETRIILTGLNRPFDMRIESVRDSRGNFCSECMMQLPNLLYGLRVIFHGEKIGKTILRIKGDYTTVYTTDTVRFFADLYLRFHETDFRAFNMDGTLLFKQAIYEYSPEELERIISMCMNTELMEEYITSERTSGECKAIVIKRMAELGVDKNRFDL